MVGRFAHVTSRPPDGFSVGGKPFFIMTNSTLVNAVPFEVTLLDGTKETVAVARLTVRQLYAAIEHIAADKTTDLVALCIAHPLEWIDRLSDESYAALARECMHANFSRAMTLAASDSLIAMKIAPIVARAIETTKLVTGTYSNASSPGFVASPVGTGSAPSTTLPSDFTPSSSPTAASRPNGDSGP